VHGIFFEKDHNDVNAPLNEYQDRLAASRRRLSAHQRTHIVCGNSRLAIIAAGIAIAILALRGALPAWWVVVPAAAFAVVGIIHGRLLTRIDRERRVAGYYERGIERVEDRWAANRDTCDGRAFGEQHAYARDLDLFGPASLFHRLNCARTAAGERTLAGWLSVGAPLGEVHARQQAVAELSAMLDFREDVAVLAEAAEVVDSDRLLSWAARPVASSSAAPLLFAACAFLTAALALAAYEGVVPWVAPAASLFMEVVVVYAWKRLQPAASGLDLAVRDLGDLAGLLHRIESTRFTSPWLCARQAALASGGLAASPAIAQLRQLASLHDSTTHNLLFAPFTQALLIPPQLVMAIGRWHRSYAPSLAAWMHAAGEIEAAASLASYAFERPSDPFPSVVDGDARFEARDLGHPLLSDGVSVRNDIALGGTLPHVLIVSGSNMSGKSTLLRAVGSNIVLALAGAPVRASSMRLSLLTIGATLRVDDSLQEQRSRFYAEILKIRSIVDLSRSRPPVMFLFDEILHGTNSHDRKAGAEAIVRALVTHDAIGLVTTHDLALARMVSELGAPAANVHFEDRLEDGRMVFDYRMRAGVVEHSNALALMRAVGLDP